MVLNMKRDIFFVARNAIEISNFIFNPSGVVVTVLRNVHPLREGTLKLNPFGVKVQIWQVFPY